MDEELLSDILTAEREIRQRISTLEQETSAQVAALAVELDAAIRQEASRLNEVSARELERAEQTARDEADTLLADADAYAARTDSFGDHELDAIVTRHMERLYPELGHDRQDEQA